MSEIKTLFDEAQIARRIESLAGEIAEQLPDELVVVGLLKGSFIFVADLVRALNNAGTSSQVEFMRLSSYGLKKTSSGEVHLLGDIPSELAGRDVLLVDDILDTGKSIAYARALLAQREVANLWVCVLLDKPSRREAEAGADFIGFTIEDLFVAGYGIDYAERYRDLPYIGWVD